jgi:3-hydroxyacyl-CoA dehydrogenase
MFFAERLTSKIPDVPEDTPVREIGKAAVIGAGTMGGGIAMNFANAGIPVTLLEVKQDALDRGLKTIRTNYENTAKRGGMKAEDVDKRMALITPTLSYDDLKDADVIIEAVFETMEVKEGVFTKLDEVAKLGAVLATNTSGLNVNQIASYTKRPGDVIGMHFFSPANVMKLLENVRGEATQKDVIATVMSLSKKIGKIPVLVGVCEGFVGNRMLRQRGIQSAYMLEEGALPHQIDKVVFDYGFPMGPFAMSDLAGNDVGWRIRQGKKEKEQRNVRYTGYIADAICELGRFGQKTGAGYYKYNLPDRTPIPDPEVEKIIEETSKKLGITRRAISDQEILERCFYPMVNEGAKILAEGMAQRSLDIDVIWVNGYGWPVYRGGPMWWADNVVGLKTIHDALLKYRDASGDPFWEPAPLLKKLVQDGKKFSTV